MSSANVSPSAPQYSHTEKQTPSLYPVLPDDNSNFRLKRSPTWKRSLNSMPAKTGRWQKVQKANNVSHYSAIAQAGTTALLPSSAIGTALTGVGDVASVLLSTVAASTGFASTGLAAFCSKLQYKITNHKKIYTLTIAKHNSVRALVSKALKDNKVTDEEFVIIAREVQKFYKLKERIQSHAKRLTGSSSSLRQKEQHIDLSKI